MNYAENIENNPNPNQPEFKEVHLKRTSYEDRPPWGALTDCQFSLTSTGNGTARGYISVTRKGVDCPQLRKSAARRADAALQISFTVENKQFDEKGWDTFAKSITQRLNAEFLKGTKGEQPHSDRVNLLECSGLYTLLDTIGVSVTKISAQNAKLLPTTNQQTRAIRGAIIDSPKNVLLERFDFGGVALVGDVKDLQIKKPRDLFRLRVVTESVKGTKVDGESKSLADAQRSDFAKASRKRNFRGEEPMVIPPSAVIIPKKAHGISADQISPSAQEVISQLQVGGFSSLVVGGAIRDLTRGKKVKDYDLVCNGSLEQMKRAVKYGIIVGKRVPILHVHTEDNTVIEVTPFKVSSAPSNNKSRTVRHREKGTLVSDSGARDFTINSLYFDPRTEQIIDLNNGYKDLCEGVIRTINDPVESFQEDPGRMLRAVRFRARTGFTLAEDAERALEDNGHWVAELNQDRHHHEVIKDIRSGVSRALFKEYAELNFLPRRLQNNERFRELLNKDDSLLNEIFARLDEVQGEGDLERDIGIAVFTTAIAIVSGEKSELLDRAPDEGIRTLSDFFTNLDELNRSVGKELENYPISARDKTRILHMLSAVHSPDKTPETERLDESKVSMLDGFLQF